MLIGGLMVAVIAFTSIELTLYLLIFSTLLSPELVFGGGSVAELAQGKVTTTQSRGVTLRLDDIILSLVCLVWLFRMAVIKDLGTVRRTPLNQPISAYLLVSLLATVAGFYADRVGLMGFFFVVKYLEYFVLFYMIINNLDDEDMIRRYLLVMLITCLLASVVGILQIPSGQRVSAPFEGEEGEPNTFGGYLVLLFCVALGIFLHVYERHRRFLLATMMAIVLIPFAFTESRSSYLSFMVSILLFIWFSERKRLIMWVCMVGIILAPVVLPQNVINRVMFTFTQQEQAGQLEFGAVKVDTSTSERLSSWKRVLTKYFPEHPLFGVGVTGGPFLDAQYPRVLLETGIVGLIVFLWLMRRIWILLRQAYGTLQDPILKGASLGVLCGYGGLMVHAIGANTFIIVRIMEPLMIMMGLIYAAYVIERDRVVAHELESIQPE